MAYHTGSALGSQLVIFIFFLIRFAKLRPSDLHRHLHPAQSPWASYRFSIDCLPQGGTFPRNLCVHHTNGWRCRFFLDGTLPFTDSRSNSHFCARSLQLDNEQRLVIAAKPRQSSPPEPSTRTTVASACISRLESPGHAGSDTLIRSTLPSGGHVLANTKTPRTDMSRVLPSSEATPDPGSLQVN